MPCQNEFDTAILTKTDKMAELFYFIPTNSREERNSKIQKFKNLMIQEFNDSRIQRFKNSKINLKDNL